MDFETFKNSRHKEIMANIAGQAQDNNFNLKYLQAPQPQDNKGEFLASFERPNTFGNSRLGELTKAGFDNAAATFKNDNAGLIDKGLAAAGVISAPVADLAETAASGLGRLSDTINYGLGLKSKNDILADDLRRGIDEASVQVQGGAISRMLNSMSQEQKDKWISLSADMIRRNGLTPKVEQDGNGEIYFYGTDENGKSYDLTPGIWQGLRNTLPTLAGELAGMGGAGSVAKLATTAAAKTGAKNTAKIIAAQTAGGAAGASGASGAYNTAQNYGASGSAAKSQEQIMDEAREEALLSAGANLAGEAVFRGGAAALRGAKNATASAKDSIEAIKETALKNGGDVQGTWADIAKKISPTYINDTLSQGAETATALAREQARIKGLDYDELVKAADEYGLSVGQSNQILEYLNQNAISMATARESGMLKKLFEAGAKGTEYLSKQLSAADTAIKQQRLLNQALGGQSRILNEELERAISTHPDQADKLASGLAEQGQNFMTRADLNGVQNSKAFYDVAKATKDEATRAYGAGLKALDDMLPNGVHFSDDALERISEQFDYFTHETTPKVLRELQGQIATGKINGKSAQELQEYLTSLQRNLKANNTHGFDNVLNSIKDELLTAAAQSASDPTAAQALIKQIRADYATFKAYDNSGLGARNLFNQKENTIITDDTIYQRAMGLINNTAKNDYQNAIKALNATNAAIFDKELINAAATHHVLDLGDGLSTINWGGLSQELRNFKPKSAPAQVQIALINKMADLQPNIERIANAIINAKALRPGPGLRSDPFARARMMIANMLSDNIAFTFGRFFKFGKRAAVRLQLLEAMSNIKGGKNILKAFDDMEGVIKKAGGEASDIKAEFNQSVKDIENAAEAAGEIFENSLNVAKTSAKIAQTQSAQGAATASSATAQALKNTNATPSQARELANANAMPSENELAVSAAINDGVSVSPRMSGYRVFYAVEKGAQAPKGDLAYYQARFSAEGFNAEASLAFSRAIAQKNPQIAKDFIETKINATTTAKASDEATQSLKDSLKQSKARQISQKENKSADNVENLNFADEIIQSAKKDTKQYEKALKEAKSHDDFLKAFYSVTSARDEKISEIYKTIAPKNKGQGVELANKIRAIYDDATADHLEIDEHWKNKTPINHGDFMEQRYTSQEIAKKYNLKREAGEYAKFKGTDGKEYTLKREFTDQWQNELGLENATSDYMPNFKGKIKEALGDSKIKLSLGSLLKLIQKNRTKYIPQIKQTLNEPDFILKQDDDLIFGKSIGDKLYFSTIAREVQDDFVVVSNSPKNLNNILNKIKNGAKIIYESENAEALRLSHALSPTNKEAIGNKILTNQPLNQAEKAPAKTQETAEPQTKNSGDMTPNELFLSEIERIKNSADDTPDKIRVLNTMRQRAILKGSDRGGVSHEALQLAKKTARELAQQNELKPALKQNETLNQTMSEAYDEFVKENGAVIFGDKNAKPLKEITDPTQYVREQSTLNSARVFPKKEAKIHPMDRYLLEGARTDFEKKFNITPIKDFGTNYAEFYRDGANAVKKVLAEKGGQVAGAFYRKELGDIDLVWGVAGTGKSDGWGLAKIQKWHSEVLPKIAEIMENGKIIKDSKGRVNIELNNDLIGLRDNWKGKKGNFWIITSYAKKSELDKGIDAIKANAGEADYSLATHKKDYTTQALKNKAELSQDKINDFADKLSKEGELLIDKAKAIFKHYNKDEYNDKLFDRIFETAKQLDVRYWKQSNPVHIGGSYTHYLNRAMVDSKILANNPERASKILLHELLHGVTARANWLYKNGDKTLLTKTQQEGIKEINELFELVKNKNKDKAWQQYATPSVERENNVDKIYGLRDSDEFIAELSNPTFREFLKEQNLFTATIKAIGKVFSYALEKLGLKNGEKATNTNALKELENALYKVIDGYDPNFTKKYVELYDGWGSVRVSDKKEVSKYIKENAESFKKAFGEIPKKQTIETYFEDEIMRPKGIGYSARHAIESYFGARGGAVVQVEPLNKALARAFNVNSDEKFESIFGGEIVKMRPHFEEFKGYSEKKALIVAQAFNELRPYARNLIIGLSELSHALPKEKLTKELFEQTLAKAKEFYENPNLVYRNSRIDNWFMSEWARKKADSLKELASINGTKNQKIPLEKLEKITQNNGKLYGNFVDENLAQKLGFKEPKKVRLSIQGDKVIHTLRRHNENSTLTKASGTRAVKMADIADFANYVKTANEHKISTASDGAKTLLSFKQINGYAVIVESIATKANELKFRTMYFSNGDYKKSNAYKAAQTLPQAKKPDAYSFAAGKTLSKTSLKESKKGEFSVELLKDK